MKQLLEGVHMLDGESMVVNIMKMLVFSTILQMVILMCIFVPVIYLRMYIMNHDSGS